MLHGVCTSCNLLLKVLAPYDSEDCRGLLKAAIRDPDPVIFLENEIVYGEAFPVTSHVSTGQVALSVFPVTSHVSTG